MCNVYILYNADFIFCLSISLPQGISRESSSTREEEVHNLAVVSIIAVLDILSLCLTLKSVYKENQGLDFTQLKYLNDVKIVLALILSFAFYLFPVPLPTHFAPCLSPALHVFLAHLRALLQWNGRTPVSTFTTSLPLLLATTRDAPKPCARSPPPAAYWSSCLKSERKHAYLTVSLSHMSSHPHPHIVAVCLSSLFLCPPCLLSLSSAQASWLLLNAVLMLRLTVSCCTLTHTLTYSYPRKYHRLLLL